MSKQFSEKDINLALHLVSELVDEKTLLEPEVLCASNLGILLSIYFHHPKENSEFTLHMLDLLLQKNDSVANIRKVIHDVYGQDVSAEYELLISYFLQIYYNPELTIREKIALWGLMNERQALTK